MICKILLTIWMAVIIVASFLYAGAAAGFPGETSRILFFHVPQAWIATLAFLISMIASAVYLAKRRVKADYLAQSAAELGFLFCVLATITGSVFAKATWGAFWNWDPRQTSIVILLMIYGAYFAIRSAVSDPDRRRVFAGVYSILAFVTVPFLVFVVPRITTSLHPENTMNPASPGMDPKTLKVFLGSLFAYTGLFVWMLWLKIRVLRIEGLRNLGIEEL
ncbi:MAG: cytochrome c biogenesis protein CcsA [Deltaproteobacteria bacterium]|nr:cytochrome c biogenesis protein CcsA [Deltaproteobacteria bacterium]MBW1792829.1 cytochrome c biogenesis protein CcsA [Deltaproteobacteria bacterium]MBW2329639.1 cytochrome c biogenesis protein CcsA [Deltaproteobacteria bacterium]